MKYITIGNDIILHHAIIGVQVFDFADYWSFSIRMINGNSIDASSDPMQQYANKEDALMAAKYLLDNGIVYDEHCIEAGRNELLKRYKDDKEHFRLSAGSAFGARLSYKESLESKEREAEARRDALRDDK